MKRNVARIVIKMYPNGVISRAAHVQVDFDDFGGFPHFYI